VRWIAYPTETFFFQVVIGRLERYEPDALAGHEALVAGVLVVIAAVGLAALARAATPHGRAGLVAGVAVAGVLAFQLLQTGYNLDGWKAQQGAQPPGWKLRAWVDRLDPGREPVAILGMGYGNGPEYVMTWDEVRFFNTAVRPVVKLGPGKTPEPVGMPLTFLTLHPSDGRITADGPVPRLAVTSHELFTLGVPLEHVADSPYLDAQLVRLPPRLQATWKVMSGTAYDGFLEPPGRAQLRVFTAGVPAGQKTCLRMQLAAPPGFRGAWDWRLHGGRRPLSGRLRATETALLRVEVVRGSAAGYFRDLRIDAPHDLAVPPDRHVGLRIQGASRGAC
jgi:hypothetical protein